ncbi:MAG: hypothetical protein HKN69_01400 [Desulfofustis sp.]|nr:hypothetical protein [Desulfofustis sp.]
MDHQHQLREAKILCASGQLYKGIESFNRVEEQGSDIVDTCLGPGAALVALRRFNEAEVDFLSAICLQIYCCLNPATFRLETIPIQRVANNRS